MAAVEWAINGASDDADVINFSGGFGEMTQDYPGISRFFDAVTDDLDVPVALAAGNYNGEVNPNKKLENNAYNALVVGACNDSGSQIWDDSATGPTTYGRKKPDLVAPGIQITSTRNINSWWETGDGTSDACAHVAGAFLLYLDYIMGSGNSAQVCKAILINTANRPPGEGDIFGWDSSYGWGSINLTRAYQNRSYWRTLSISQGQSKYYKGWMFPSDNERNRATLVWQIHVSYNGANPPPSYMGLSDVNLKLWDYTNNVKGSIPIMKSESLRDNVEQVWLSSGSPKQVLIEVYGYWVNGGTEWVTLATPSGFTQVTNPAPALPTQAKELLAEQQAVLKSALHPNVPNPFNPETWIPFTLEQASDVVIEIYDIQGKRVRELKLGRQEAGEYLPGSGAAYFDGRNASGDTLAQWNLLLPSDSR